MTVRLFRILHCHLGDETALQAPAAAAAAVVPAVARRPVQNSRNENTEKRKGAANENVALDASTANSPGR